MTLRNKQNVLITAGLACSSGAVGFAAFGSWVGAAFAFAASSLCWSAAMWFADKRRERLGSAVVRETRRVEEQALGVKRRAMERGADVGYEFRVAATTAANIRTATTRIIADA